MTDDEIPKRPTGLDLNDWAAYASALERLCTHHSLVRGDLQTKVREMQAQLNQLPEPPHGDGPQERVEYILWLYEDARIGAEKFIAQSRVVEVMREAFAEIQANMNTLSWRADDDDVKAIVQNTSEIVNRAALASESKP